MTIQITKSGTVFSGNNEDLECMQIEFDQNHCIKLPNLLEPTLLHFIQTKLKQDKFIEDKYKVGNDDAIGYRLGDESLVGSLHFLINDQILFQLIEQITGCKKIGCFTGRVYSKIPTYGQYDSWHDDLTDNRMIAMSINLSTGIYSGGILQILNTKTKQIVHEAANTGIGEGLIFHLAPYLEHRVTKVHGKVTRTVLTGWFRSKPIYKPIFKPLSTKEKVSK